jgi:LCP family protein required for cell wall assembly
LYGVDHRLNEGGLVEPEGLAARAMVDREALRIDGSGQELRPAQIDADHAAGRHFDHDTPFAMDEEKPNYTRYRSRPKLFGKRGGGARDGLDDLRGGHPRPDQGGKRKLAQRFTFWRVLGYVGLAAVGWVLISLLLFLISAQVQRQKVTNAVDTTLKHSGIPLTSPNTILVLGSDARVKGTKEPGANVGGPSRSDTILLMRVGGGHSARLSIPRDTFAQIPGHGTDKINAAYAYGGPALAVKTVAQYLGIPINHLIEVNFENFPDFIDSLGGINYTGGCVISRINGGSRNGGYTLRLPPGKNHLNGKQALALARTRKNECNKAEDDLSRARRQQKILAAIKSRLLSPATFFRLPLVSWQAPKAVRSDMAGPDLLGLFGAIATGGSPATRVLKGVPEGNGLRVPDAVKRREVQQFLKG